MLASGKTNLLTESIKKCGLITPRHEKLKEARKIANKANKAN